MQSASPGANTTEECMKHRIARNLPNLRLLEIAALLIIIGLLSACASTGATWRSGVGDAWFERPPYTAGPGAAAGSRIAHVPITYQQDPTQRPFGPAAGPGSAIAALLAELNAGLDDLEGSVRAPVGPLRGTPPDVHFGCERLPGDECADADPRAPHRLAVGRPSRPWVADAAALAGHAGADYLLVITLEIGSYLPRQRNLRGDKEILLGTHHSQAVRWLTALDRPAEVLQLTGALVDREGRVVRIAAEGLTARTTHVVAGGFGLQALLTDADIEHARTTRRTDVPGAPLLWQHALENLVASISRREWLADSRIRGAHSR
jgi:hypothetical protein